MTTRTPGRHRAARRPITPLTPISRAAARGISGAARRGALVAAGSGLAVSLLSAPADAAPVVDHGPSTAELDILTEASRSSVSQAAAAQAVTTAPAVQVAADSKFTLETGTIEVTPAPEPEPVPEPEPEPVVEEVVETAAPVAEAPVEEAVEQAVPAAAAGSDIVSIAMQYLGVPYVWAGSTPAGFDCSGFTSYVYAQAGIDLPRTSSEQRYAGTAVSAAEAQPGDLIWSPGHIAIYAGDGMQVEAPVPGQTVRYTEIWQDSPTFIRVG
ncbi:C40 family peptidase [Promicromonospora iranensis]|uniref:Cell wall-associated NlpC family hydrolase n=1 Tax=Promicromonospora iranensis TaxID=1105144 RepID=A0ABU2CJY3_9MICO|nr:C40 family peptidase [Promicromonospora iranensis]MDR7381641.1 cell wall-associated NlpC family hydrolase [Promicromonospora iranensis]